MADNDGSMSGIIVYAVFLLASVLVGPLEAVLGLAVYWLFEMGAERANAA